MDRFAPESYTTGVSLHSHTNQSKETLDFLAMIGKKIRWVNPWLKKLEARAHNMYSTTVDYAAAYWTPPLTPRLAFELEGGQIEKLGLRPLVSISDHDTITAPMLLRTVDSARHIPVSVEWSVPFGGDQSFHLGIHNLPSETGAEWMERFAAFTATGSQADPALLNRMLRELHALPNVLIIFNHPMWDLYQVGTSRHGQLLRLFLEENAPYMHAFELNGLRSWSENRAVKRLAAVWNKLLISGGDRHGTEPNANINLTNAASFTEFVHEIRYERQSHLLFLPQYAEPIKHRILRSTIDVIRDYPDFPQGSRRWDERVFHPDSEGIVRPLAELWPGGQPPRYMLTILAAVRMLGSRPVSGGLKRAWDERAELQLALDE